MRKYRKMTATTSRNMYLKKSIAGSRRRAKIFGMLYLLGAVALAVAACMPLLVHELAMVGVANCWNVLKHFFVNLLAGNPLVVDEVLNTYTLDTYEGLCITINAFLYAIMLVAVMVNALKALGKLGWLFNKKGTKEYGFNRNAYAMEDMGRAFSGSFAWILITYLIIGLICGGFATLINTMMLIVIAAGVVIHLVCGFFGAKVRYYDLENGQIVEQKRVFGRFSCLLRNVFQLVAVAAIVYLLNFEALSHEIGVFLQSGEEAKMIMFVFLLQMVAVLALFVLIKHATAMTEYSIEGVYGSGMKNFRIFTFIVFLVMAAGAALCAMQSLATDEYLPLVLVAVVALVSFIIEIIMRKYPRLPEDLEEKKLCKGEGEFSFDTLSRLQQEMEQNSRPQHPTVII